MRARLVWLISVALLQALALASPEPGALPVLIADNHAASFGWFARVVDLDEPHALLLIDAHSDASAVSHSDEVRDGLRRVASEAQRVERVADWRATGRIEAFGWIEPLMPSPIDRVVWLARWMTAPEEKARLQAEAADAVDGRIELEARAAGDLGQRWSVIDGEEFAAWTPPPLPLLATIDLDFFSEMTPAEQAVRFELVWKRLLTLPRLRAVSFAISRPWQKDDAQAARLLRGAVEAARLVRGARVEIEPFEAPGPDDSLKAREYALRGQATPRLNVAEAPFDLRALIAANRDRWTVAAPVESRWCELIDAWRQEAGDWVIHADGVLPSTDKIWRVDEAALPVLRVWSPLDSRTPGRTRWRRLKPAEACYNLVPEALLGKGFTHDAGPWVREEREPVAETADGALPPEMWRALLDARTGWGVVRLEAEIETARGWASTPPIELRVTSGSGFHAGLSEQFGLPYAFGIAAAQPEGPTGPDLGWGNDCANFLIAAWRRTGRDLPWSDPARLRKHMETIVEEATAESRTPITPEQVELGVEIDFGRHAAALWEDREPKGVLDANDLVVHHLGGFPERTTLGALAALHGSFAVRTLSRKSATRIQLGGDIVLAGPSAPAGADLPGTPNRADLIVANLEGIPASRFTRGAERYNFSFPPERLTWLKRVGLSAVGLANNHAGDAEAAGVSEGVDHVSQAGLGLFGAGEDLDHALEPWEIERGGVRFAFFAAACVESLAAGPSRGGVVTLPAAAAPLAQAMSRAQRDGAVVVVLAHWGSEYSHEPDAEQRTAARWLIDHGADVVAGAHPHVCQPLDFYRGKCVAYSLGNLVFPAALNHLGDGAWLDVEFDAHGAIARAVLRPLVK